MTIATGARGWGAMLATVASLAAVMLTAGLVARGQEGEGKAGRDDQKALEERWGREVAAYRVVAHSEPEVELTLKSEPVLRWTNPVRRPTVGLVFLWVGQGRPAAVSCFYRVRFDGRLIEAHEFVSLAPVGVTAVLRGQTVWSPPGSGLQPRPIPGAPRPAETPAERLRQLRDLVREFHASVDVDTEPTELRLLPQPVARFAGGDANATATGRSRPPTRRCAIRLRLGHRPGGLARDRRAPRLGRPRLALRLRADVEPEPYRPPPRPACLGSPPRQRRQ